MNHTTVFTGEEAEARLRQNAEQFQRVLWIEDFATRYLLYVSPTYEKIWGLTRRRFTARRRNFSTRSCRKTGRSSRNICASNGKASFPK